jgi:hypothetical protein
LYDSAPTVDAAPACAWSWTHRVHRPNAKSHLFEAAPFPCCRICTPGEAFDRRARMGGVCRRLDGRRMGRRAGSGGKPAGSSDTSLAMNRTQCEHIRRSTVRRQQSAPTPQSLRRAVTGSTKPCQWESGAEACSEKPGRANHPSREHGLRSAPASGGEGTTLFRRHSFPSCVSRVQRRGLRSSGG